MAKRRIKQDASVTKLPIINEVKPRQGLAVSIYFSRADVGSGIREYLIIKCGRKYITLFYAPRLMSIQITHLEWAALRVVRPYTISNMVGYCQRIKGNMAQFDRLHLQYSTVAANAAIKLLECK